MRSKLNQACLLESGPREVAYCCGGRQSACAAADGAALQELLEQLLVELAVVKGLRIPLLRHALQVVVLLLRLGLLIRKILLSLRLHSLSSIALQCWSSPHQTRHASGL